MRIIARLRYDRAKKYKLVLMNNRLVILFGDDSIYPIIIIYAKVSAAKLINGSCRIIHNRLNDKKVQRL